MLALTSAVLCLTTVLVVAVRTGMFSPAEAATSAAVSAAPSPSPPTGRPAGVPVIRPSDRPLRVLFVGDSLMYGSFASDESLTYRARIVDALRVGGPIEAVQVGGPGQSAAGATRLLQKRSGPFDLVFVELGANDSVAITPAQFAADYTALLDAIRTMAPGAGLVCDGVWNGPKFALPLDRELRPVCAAHGGVVVPLTRLYVDETLRGPEGSVVPGGGVRDQFHPNDAGHEAIAQSMLGVLRY